MRRSKGLAESTEVYPVENLFPRIILLDLALLRSRSVLLSMVARETIAQLAVGVWLGSLTYWQLESRDWRAIPIPAHGHTGEKQTEHEQKEKKKRKKKAKTQERNILSPPLAPLSSWPGGESKPTRDALPILEWQVIRNPQSEKWRPLALSVKNVSGSNRKLYEMFQGLK